MKKFALCMAAAWMVFIFTGVAWAQRGVPVPDKPRPDYDPIGVRAGAFVAKPQLTLGLEYNDNIYATKDDTKSDWITVLAPSVGLHSDWNRHALGLDVGLKGGIYASESDENYLDADLFLSGRVDVRQETFLTGRFGTSRLHEERGSPDASQAWKKPGVYYLSVAEAAYLHGVGRSSLTAGAWLNNYSFQSVDLVDGGKDSRELRDRNEYNLNVRYAYELLPNVQPFLAAEYEWRKYDKSEARRDSDGYRIGAGTGFDLGGVTTGEIFAGYMRQDYDKRENIDGAWYGLSLLWSVTEMTSLQGYAVSSVKETTAEGSSGINSVDAGLRVDHELLRNLLIGAFFDYTYDDYKGVEYTDNYYTLGPRLTYLWNRNLSAGAEYSHKTKDSNFSNREYTENKFALSLTGRF